MRIGSAGTARIKIASALVGAGIVTILVAIGVGPARHTDEGTPPPTLTEQVIDGVSSAGTSTSDANSGALSLGSSVAGDSGGAGNTTEVTVEAGEGGDGGTVLEGDAVEIVGNTVTISEANGGDGETRP